jgi:putative PIN family toxin of toxin-antitoxin system
MRLNVTHTIKKAVFDTNILVSAFVFPGGIIREIMNLALKKQVVIYVSEQILEEYSRVLRQKFKWSDEAISVNIGLLRRIFTVINPDILIKAVRADHTDDKVIECAVGAGADVIISGDRHLLNLNKYKAIPILSPAEFLRTMMK